jgi:hypothetical protein
LAKPLTKDLCVGPGELKTAPKEEERKTEESMKASRPAESSAGPGDATQYYDIDMSPPRKDREAQPVGALARKLQGVPPAALLSLQGRSGALRLSAALPTVTLRWHVPVGEYKEVLINLRRPASASRLWMDDRGETVALCARLRSRTAHLRPTPRYQVQGEIAPRVLFSDPYCDIDCAW